MGELTITIYSPSPLGFTCKYEEDFIAAAQMAIDTLRTSHGIVAYYSIETNLGGVVNDNTTKLVINGREICDGEEYEKRFGDPYILAGYLVEEALRLFGKKDYFYCIAISTSNQTILSTAMEV
ncbi:MAG: hypothetical protein F7B59_03470 [Desulfurococcales archaeon]|nr:hypothetical protein [Desulfurococcales archaeon]